MTADAEHDAAPDVRGLGASAPGDGPAGGVGAGPLAGGSGSDGSAHGGVEVRVADGGTTVRFWGAIDLSVRIGGTGALGDIPSDASPMTVDCRDVAFMDSTGLSVLVRVVRDAAADGRPVRFLGASTPVQHLLEATGVDQWMSALGVRADA